MTRSTSNEQSSEATQEVPPTLDDNTFYVRVSAAGTLDLGIDVQTTKDQDTSATHGFVVYTKVPRRDFGLLLSNDPGPAEAIETIPAELRDFAKDEASRTDGQNHTAVDGDTLLRSKMDELKVKLKEKFRGSKYKVEFLDGPELSATDLENQSAETLRPRQIDNLEYAMTQRMRRVAEEEQPSAGTSARSTDRTNIRTTARRRARTAALPPTQADIAIYDPDDMSSFDQLG
jgi:hypothetical protein